MADQEWYSMWKGAQIGDKQTSPPWANTSAQWCSMRFRKIISAWTIINHAQLSMGVLIYWIALWNHGPLAFIVQNIVSLAYMFNAAILCWDLVRAVTCSVRLCCSILILQNLEWLYFTDLSLLQFEHRILSQFVHSASVSPLSACGISLIKTTFSVINVPVTPRAPQLGNLQLHQVRCLSLTSV